MSLYELRYNPRAWSFGLIELRSDPPSNLVRQQVFALLENEHQARTFTFPKMMGGGLTNCSLSVALSLLSAAKAAACAAAAASLSSLACSSYAFIAFDTTMGEVCNGKGYAVRSVSD